MVTLHIEHPITDLNVWLAAFDRFAEARAKAGVRAHRVLHRVDDPNHIVIDLDFSTPEEATRFLAFLQNNVWSSTDSAPALAGAPQTMLLQALDLVGTSRSVSAPAQAGGMARVGLGVASARDEGGS